MTNLTVREAAQAILDGKPLEFRVGNGKWILDEQPIVPIKNNNLNGQTIYRLAPETITVNGVKVPKPESKPLAMWHEYWVAAPGFEKYAAKMYWRDSMSDALWLSRGLIHLTEAAAVAHTKAMLGVV